MIVTPAHQFLDFLAAAAAGVISGAFYIFAYHFAKKTKSRFYIALFDILSVLLAGLLLALTIYFLNDGKPEWYHFLGLAAGIAIDLGFIKLAARLKTAIVSQRKSS
ncbi:MAG TPA: spore cortex biosynthesis protein YabQ [Eubacteriales bacterium]|jgi:predicted permease|nr:spore cortex biosynthesis protein YabQ [Clostridia bacterium]HRR89760.1 spore cortex biosynthesis protein YabQ [Eubacteriales bacterium]HRU84588.1 spore cortex biosynthesis protein YabQ [Eubacteriales bacterium]